MTLDLFYGTDSTYAVHFSTQSDRVIGSVTLFTSNSSSLFVSSFHASGSSPSIAQVGVRARLFLAITSSKRQWNASVE